MTSWEHRQLLKEIDQLREQCRDLTIIVQQVAHQTWDMPPYVRGRFADLIDGFTDPNDLEPPDAFGVPA